MPTIIDLLNLFAVNIGCVGLRIRPLLTAFTRHTGDHEVEEAQTWFAQIMPAR